MSEQLTSAESRDGHYAGAPAAPARSRIDRALLVMVLVFQLLILGMLVNQRRTAGPAPAGPDTAAGGLTSRGGRTARIEADPRRMAMNHPAAVAAALRNSDALFDHMDALFEQTVGEIAAMDRLFDPDARWASLPVSPFLDMRETGGRYIVIYGVPGMRPSDVQVVLNDRILTIHAAMECPPDAHRRGRSYQMDRSVQLPGPVGDLSLASAGLTNGLLKVALPRAQTSARVIAVPVRLF